MSALLPTPLTQPPATPIVLNANANVNLLVAEADIALSNSGVGIVQVAVTSTLATVTSRGNTTANVVNFTTGLISNNVNVSNTITSNLSITIPQSSGWGNATGALVTANFSGSSANVAVCANAIAEIITALKGVGIIGA